MFSKIGMNHVISYVLGNGTIHVHRAIETQGNRKTVKKHVNKHANMFTEITKNLNYDKLNFVVSPLCLEEWEELVDVAFVDIYEQKCACYKNFNDCDMFRAISEEYCLCLEMGT